MILRIATPLLLGAVAIALIGCESSQDKSARLKRQGVKAIGEQRGLVITKKSTDVKVVQTGVVTDSNGTAAAVTLRDTKAMPLGTLPIAITVVDPNGKAVFRNNSPGLQESLTSLAALPAKHELTWVNDQVTPNGSAVRVRAEIGAGSTAPGSLPKVEIEQPHLTTDPTSGVEAVGKITNRSSIAQLKLFVYIAAWKNGKLVSAGRGAIQKLNPGAHTDYHVFLIGNPRGAQFTVSAPPTVLR
jgi:hypothetical protein